MASQLIVKLARIARSADRCDSQSDSVRPSVCLSVTFPYFVQMNEDMIVSVR